MNCSNCGTYNSSDSKVCIKCGQNLTQNTPAQPAPQTVESLMQSTPVQPTPQTVESLMQSTLAQPTHQTVESSMQSTPAQPAPQTVESLMQSTPAQPTSQTVESLMQSTPVQSAPQTVESSTQNTSVQSAPQTVESSTQNTPVQPVPQTAESSMQNTPVQPVPQTVESSMQNTPVQPTMEDMLKTEKPIKNSNNSPKMKNINIKKILLILFILAVVIILFFVGYKLLTKSSVEDKDFDITSTSSFFLSNESEKYALFNDDGKQLTDFIYTDADRFINNTAVVEIDKEVGLINSDGKTIIPMGKYDSISAVGGLYSAMVDDRSDGTFSRYILDNTGKVLYNLDDISVKEVLGIDTFLILDYKNDNKYVIVNYDGKEIISFPKVSGADVPSANELENYVMLYYNNKNWLLDIVAGKEVVSFDSETQYCVNAISNDNAIITLNSCSKWEINDNNKTYRFIKNGKVYDKTNECEKVYLKENNLICYKNNKEYLFDNNLNVGIDTTGKAYNSNDVYVMNGSKTSDGAYFYQSGNLYKNVSCRNLFKKGYMQQNFYVLNTYNSNECGTKSGSYEIYNSNGEKAINKSFTSVQIFDENGLAIVSEDGKNYYLLNTKGEQVGGNYDKIFLRDGYYMTTKDKLEGIIDKNGVEILPCEYKDVYTTSFSGDVVARVTISDSEYMVYNVDTKKEIIKSTTKPDTAHEHYFITSENNKKQYYTYNGKMVLEK